MREKVLVIERERKRRSRNDVAQPILDSKVREENHLVLEIEEF